MRKKKVAEGIRRRSKKGEGREKRVSLLQVLISSKGLGFWGKKQWVGFENWRQKCQTEIIYVFSELVSYSF